MNIPKITIVTVCFNAVQDIEKTILSVASQTYSNKEFIIIDGGSNDGTIEIIKKYQSQIDKWISEPDKGIYDAMNKAIKMAKGEWLNFMNAGDIFVNENVLKNVFSEMIPEGSSFLYSNYWLEGNDKKEFFLCEADRSKGVFLHQSSIYKKNLHEKYGYYLTTRQYTVSDLLFFLSVPESEFYKVKTVISRNSFGGVSSNGAWCRERAECLRVVFNIKSIHEAYWIYIKRQIKESIPYSFRRFIGKYFLGHK